MDRLPNWKGIIYISVTSAAICAGVRTFARQPHWILSELYGLLAQISGVNIYTKQGIFKIAFGEKQQNWNSWRDNMFRTSNIKLIQLLLSPYDIMCKLKFSLLFYMSNVTTHDIVFKCKCACVRAYIYTHIHVYYAQHNSYRNNEINCIISRGRI